MDAFPDHIILLPGFMCDHRLFGPLIEQLEAAGRSWSVAPLTGSDSVAGMAEGVLEDAPSRFALIGLSMGGIVALNIARRAPERLSHLALLNTTPFEDRISDTRQDHLRRLLNGEMEKILRDEMKPNYMHAENATDALLDMVLDMGKTLGERVFTRQTMALMTRDNQVETLSHIPCPTLVLTGEQDPLCPPSIHQFMAEQIQTAHLALLSQCGHLSTLEQPDAVWSALQQAWGHPNSCAPFSQTTKTKTESRPL